jgi:TetR/AcrR family transcriptional repressor of nem operon
MCDHPDAGCPLPPLASELARANAEIRAQTVAQLVKYKSRMQPFMPGRQVADKERAFFVIFSTMTGAIAIARLLPPAVRDQVLASARDFLLRSF